MTQFRIPLKLKPVTPTIALMKRLEKKGLIIRLAPGRHELKPVPGQSMDQTIYASEPQWGPHKVISVTSNRQDFPRFGTHPDNEEFLMVGDPRTRPLFLVIAWCKKEALQQKIQAGRLKATDFVALKIRFNDPQLSFFVMLKDTPHGEAAAGGKGKPPTFYVTESKDLPLDITNFEQYELSVSAR